MPTVSVHLPIEGSQSTEIKEFQVEEGQVLFDQLEDQGLTLPHGCLAGSCGSCRIEILEGSENLKPAGAIERDTIETITQTYKNEYGEDFLKGKTLRLSCRTRVLGNVSLSPIK